MYCPKCSRQQLSDEIRFCPRCGFQLDAVKKLLDGENPHLPTTIAAENEASARINTSRKRDVITGASVMLVGSISIALLTISTIAGTPLQAVIIPLLLFWAAIVSLLLLSGHAAREATKLFSKDTSALQTDVSADYVTKVNASRRQESLPPAQSAPIPESGLWRTRTAELAQPLSIAEHTTDSLNQKGA